MPDTDTSAPATTPAPARGTSPWEHARRKLFRNRVACTGGVIVILLYVAACLAGFLSPYDWNDASPDAAGTPPMLFGGYEMRELQEAAPDGHLVTVYQRRWRW